MSGRFSLWNDSIAGSSDETDSTSGFGRIVGIDIMMQLKSPDFRRLPSRPYSGEAGYHHATPHPAFGHLLPAGEKEAAGVFSSCFSSH